MLFFTALLKPRVPLAETGGMGNQTRTVGGSVEYKGDTRTITGITDAAATIRRQISSTEGGSVTLTKAGLMGMPNYEPPRADEELDTCCREAWPGAVPNHFQ